MVVVKCATKHLKSLKNKILKVVTIYLYTAVCTGYQNFLLKNTRCLIPSYTSSRSSFTDWPITESSCLNQILKFGFINMRSLSTEALLINDLILQHNLDMSDLCETWLKPNVFLLLN